jgi:3D (Asp-Asp-Asp) domain-containing protein
MKTFPDATFTDVVSPNADTLYSQAWLDLEKKPIVLSVPATHMAATINSSGFSRRLALDQNSLWRRLLRNATIRTVVAVGSGLGMGFALPFLTLGQNPPSPNARLASPSSGVRRRPTIRYFIATAYSVEGTGASGKWSHPGTAAADRKVLPLNTRIRIYGAGRYSGDYTVEDTGGKVDGQHIDVYMPSRAEAKRFGRQRVKVVVLKYGDDNTSQPDPQQKAEAKAVDRNVRAKTNTAPEK